MMLSMSGTGDGPTVADVPMKIDRLSEVPTYRQLADELRRLISTGQLKSGDRLPSIHELMAETGLAQNTIRSAVAVLREIRLQGNRQLSGDISCCK